LLCVPGVDATLLSAFGSDQNRGIRRREAHCLHIFQQRFRFVNWLQADSDTGIGNKARYLL
jgi:hypothetical protein